LPARPLRRGEYFVNALDQQPQPLAEIARWVLKPISSTCAGGHLLIHEE
jgi:hypothetical protein